MSLAALGPERPANDELRQFRESVRRFLSQNATPAQVQAWREEKVVSGRFWRLAADAGFLGLCVPEAYGGPEVDFRFDMVLMEELAAIGLEQFGAPLHNSVVAPYIVSFGSEEQKARWLPKMVTGELIGAIAMTEPGAGSDLRGIRTTARRDGEHYVLNGQKTYITNGQTANLIVVVAQTGDDRAAARASLLIVETEVAQGFSRGRNLDKVGMEYADTSELFFEDVRVPVENLLGAEGGGLHQLMAKLPQERLIIAVQGVAVIERAVALTLDFVSQRRAFGQAILRFQNTQFKLAECKTEATIARVFVDHCLDLHVEGRLDATTAAMAKYWVTDLQCKIIDECLQLHGGAGYMLEYPIAQMYRDSRAQRIYGGTNEIMKLLIARSLEPTGAA